MAMNNMPMAACATRSEDGDLIFATLKSGLPSALSIDVNGCERAGPRSVSNVVLYKACFFGVCREIRRGCPQSILSGHAAFIILQLAPASRGSSTASNRRGGPSAPEPRPPGRVCHLPSSVILLEAVLTVPAAVGLAPRDLCPPGTDRSERRSHR